MTDVIVHGLATIKHLNIRKEGPDDEKVLALDIKLADCQCSLPTLARILGANSWTDVRTAFWDTDGEPRFLGLEPISSWSNIHGCTVEMLGITMRGAQVRKFKVRICGEESAEMEMSVSVSSPPDKATPILAEYVMESVTVKITKEQGELDLEPADDTGVDKETGEVLFPESEALEDAAEDHLYEHAVAMVRSGTLPIMPSAHRLDEDQCRKEHPVDPDDIDDDDELFDPKKHTSHFSTCSDAEQDRRSR